MKKVFILLASAAVVLTLALSVGCEKPDTEGDFSVELVGDTIKQDTAGASVNFEFVLKNNTDDNLTLSLDLPQDLQELPTNWWGSICDTLCYLLPHEVDVPAKGSHEGLHVAIQSDTLSTEGKVVMTVTDGEEVDSQTFILRIEG